MPQNAVIAATGGDYTTLKEWHDAEKNSNYGAPTRCYVNGGVPVGLTNLTFHSSGGNWPNGVEVFALVGQEFNGANYETCARIFHTANMIHLADADVHFHGLCIAIPGDSYAARNISFSQTLKTTRRRNIAFKKCAILGTTNQYGETHQLDFRLNSTATNNQFNLDISDIVFVNQAAITSIGLSSVSGNLDISGSIKNITVVPLNPFGSAGRISIDLGKGPLCTVNVSKVSTFTNQLRVSSIDFRNDSFSGVVSSIATSDLTGTVTGVTTASELMDYANGDYRAKPTGAGYGAFLQGATPPAAASNIRAYIGGQFVSGKIKVRQNNAWVNAVARV